MATVLILAGGASAEREVSLRSGAAVAAALEKAGHTIKQLDPADDLSNATLLDCDVLFPVLHGTGGEDGVLQARLEALGISFVGSNSAASSLCFDKWRYKQLLREHQLPNPDGELVQLADIPEHRLFKQPFVLKPNDDGSSVDTFIVRDVANLDWAPLRAAFERHEQMLLEELIPGTEITVGILGEQALPVIEIIPPTDAEFDYENKYNGRTQELCPPEHVTEAVQEKARALALQIHKLCGCRDFSRTDMIVTSAGEVRVLETNTIPGLTDQSLLPKAALTAGISMVELSDSLVKAALARRPSA